MNRKKLILWIALILLIISSSIVLYKGFAAPKVISEENAFFTDAPGDTAGKDYIDGEVFMIKKGDPYFNR